jgi:hypothetical protein
MNDPSQYPAAQWALLIVQVAGLIGLLVYVWKTWHIAKSTELAAQASANTVAEMRHAREEASAPHVMVYFSTASAFLAEVVIENFGDGTAADVICTFEPALQATGDGEPAAFFTTPKWLPPRSRLVHAFDSWPDYLGSSLPRRYNVTVSYKDGSLRRAYSNLCVLDVAAFEHMMRWERKDIDDVAKILKTLADGLQRSLSRRQSREDRRDAIWQATPIDAPAETAIAQLIGSWRLFSALEAAPNTYAFTSHHFAGMRRAAASAMAAALRSGAAADRLDAIEAAFVALHNHDFEVMANHGPAHASLSSAIERLQALWYPSMPPPTAPDA